MFDEMDVIKGKKELPDEDKIKTVAYLPSDTMGCGYYRCVLPSIGLCSRGYPAHILSKDRVFLYNIADVLVLQTQKDPDTITLIEEAQDSGITVLYEIDDNIWDVPKYNQSYVYWTTHRKNIIERIIRACDGVTTTTPYLSSVLEKFNSNVKIVPNGIFPDVPFAKLPPQIATSDKIVVGWIGASLHKADIKIFEHLVPTLIKKYNNLYFLFMGQPPPNKFKPIADKIIFIPWVDSINYHKAIGSFSMSIGLAPLVNNEFNRCKSAIKTTEYMYMKTFPILSDIYPYQEIVKESGIGELIPTNENSPGTVDEWMDLLSYYIDNIDKTKELGEKGHQWVMENYNVKSDRMFGIYKDVYGLSQI